MLPFKETLFPVTLNECHHLSMEEKIGCHVIASRAQHHQVGGNEGLAHHLFSLVFRAHSSIVPPWHQRSYLPSVKHFFFFIVTINLCSCLLVPPKKDGGTEGEGMGAVNVLPFLPYSFTNKTFMCFFSCICSMAFSLHLIL